MITKYYEKVKIATEEDSHFLKQVSEKRKKDKSKLCNKNECTIVCFFTDATAAWTCCQCKNDKNVIIS